MKSFAAACEEEVPGDGGDGIGVGQLAGQPERRGVDVKQVLAFPFGLLVVGAVGRIQGGQGFVGERVEECLEGKEASR